MGLGSNYPFFIRLYNRLMSVQSFDAQQLIKRAQKEVNLTDFGDLVFEKRLELLGNSINKEAQLHAFGSFMNKERLLGLLKNRLRAVEYLKQHPKIEQETIQPPIIIAGLQRTGTTFLQRLLHADSDNRALLSWEALNPIPLNGKGEEKRRIKQAKLSQRALKYISPIFFSIHPVEYDSPEEEILLNDMTLLSAVPEALMNVAEYSKWVEQQDHSIAYDWMEKMLKVLQYNNTPKTWILKTPQHLEYMDVIAEKFPKATIIHTHRNPKECIPSFCSMIYHSRKMFSPAVNPVDVANHWVNKNVYMLKQTIQARQNNPHLKVIDVYYTDLVKDPIRTVQKIYAAIGRPWNERVATEIKQATKRNKKDKYGKHHYDKADFGLTDAGIEQQFDFYLDYAKLS